MRIVVHGGAGHSAEEQDGVDAAAGIGWELLAGGADAVSAAVTAVVALEDDPRFNAGTGSCLRADGSVQVDAAEDWFLSLHMIYFYFVLTILFLQSLE